jgi:lipoprotein-anchoring transpeptidase ErfK/SrfK
MKRSTIVVLVIFLALVGLLLYLNKKEPPEEKLEATPTAPVEYLFSDSDGQPTSIDIKSEVGDQVVISRNEAGVWVLEQPIETEADQASAEEAASQVTTLRIESKPEVDPEAAGLTQPSYTLTVEMTGGTEKSVRIGNLTPTEIGYYVSVNDSDETLIINRTGLDALLNLLENPPIVKPTPTNMP